MALSNLHTNYKVSYKNDLINLTKLKENGSLLGGSLDNLNAQADKTANSIALGYGYDAFQHYDTITTDLAGLATSKQSGLSDIQAIQAVKDLIDTHRVKVGDNWQFKEGGGIKTLEDLRDKINLRITLSTEKNAETLMLKELNSMEMKVKAKTGLGESNELIALVDLAFNGGVGIIGSNLVNAINTDNRVAAWYEIRYNTNKNKDDGLQNRRKEQSDLLSMIMKLKMLFVI